MPLTPDLVEEIRILTLFDPSTTLAGIKVHSSTAEPAAVVAARRLHDKGLVTLPDGGYLTERGQEAAEHARALFALLAAH